MILDTGGTRVVVNNRIDTLEELLALYGQPAAMSIDKETPFINDVYQRLIKASPFFTIATIGPDGMDCSPRGDAPGFVSILDDKTIAIPDRRGNNRLDTLRNIVADPRVALLFLIPGLNETFRINGSAHLSTDPELLESFSVDGKKPASAIIVTIETMYFQCARALKRSSLWDVSAQQDQKTLPTAGDLVRSVAPDFDGKSYDSALQERQNKSLY